MAPKLWMAFSRFTITLRRDIAGQLGTALFDGDDPFAQRRQLDDRRFAADHFAVKLLRLPATMQTEAGRKLASRRAELMRSFLVALAQELGARCPGEDDDHIRRRMTRSTRLQADCRGASGKVEPMAAPGENPPTSAGVACGCGL
jgi:hypothetical protein